MTMKIALLVRTPQQFPGESPLGFILRVSELNGYESPRHLFSMAKSTRNQMFMVGIDMSKIAEVLGRGSDRLMGYGAKGETDVSRIELCGHSLTPKDLDLAMPKICPECIQEQGFIPAWTDLALVNTCPAHGRILLTVCSGCGDKLSWYRPGLLRCRCGTDLIGARGKATRDEHAALLSQVVAKFTGVAIANPCGMPVAQFESMTLRRMLLMAQGIARFDRVAQREPFWSVAASAGRIFSKWPENLFSLLRELVPSNAADIGIVVMRQHLEGIYRVVLRDVSSAEDIAFFRETIADFSLSLRGSATLELNQTIFRRPSNTANPLQTNATGPKHGRPRESVSKKKHEKHENSPQKWLAAKAQVGERTFGARDAAKRVGLPVSVLQSLRRSGHFEVHHTASRIVAFHEADILAFEAKVNALHAHPFASNAEVLSLGRAMNLKFKFDAGKGEFVAAVLDGKFLVIGSEKRGLCVGRLHEAGAMFIAKNRK